MAFRDSHLIKTRPEINSRRVIWLGLLLTALVFGLTFILTAHLTIRDLTLRGDLKEGDVSSQNIRAPKRVTYVSAIETKAERERAANSVPEAFVFDPGIAPQQRNKLNNVIQAVSGARGTPSMNADAKKSAIKRALDFDLTDPQLSLLIGMDDFQWLSLSSNAPRVLYEVLSERVTAERLRDLKLELPARLSAITGEQERNIAVELVRGYARANYSPNPSETQRLRKEAQDSVAPVTKTVEKGEIILREGDVVRGTDLEKLEALGLTTPAIEWTDIAASLLQVLVVVFLIAAYIWGFESWLLSHERMLLLIALVMLVTVLSAKIIIPGRPYWGYVFPISGVAMLLATLVDAQLAILVTTLLGVLVGGLAGDSLELTTICIVGALLGAIGVRKSERLHSYFVAGVMVAVGTFAVILGYRFSVKELELGDLLTKAGISGVNGLLASTLTVGTFSLLGRAFGITTSMQLLELSDPTQPLLRRLLNEAPGTYHHSIMVGNLAERAAEQIGAEQLLVRVGAYYHDVGKLVRPYFFIENQFDGQNAHDTLDPETSARIVATHVKDGLELAARYGLPQRVQEFISEHHGTRMVGYFYHKATQEGSGQVDTAPFSYPGPRPRSKEAGIVMLADSVEAVVRAAKDHSAENISNLVRKVVDERLSEGQLDDCDLTIRDLEKIKRAFTEILMGMYHPRIEYPGVATPESAGVTEREKAASSDAEHAGQPAT